MGSAAGVRGWSGYSDGVARSPESPAMSGTPRGSLLCVSSYFKGNRFIQRAKREGWRVFLLTAQGMLDKQWPRDHLDDAFAMPSLADRRSVINAVAYLMRSRPIDRIVALDDYDVELAAHLREHFRLP